LALRQLSHQLGKSDFTLAADQGIKKIAGQQAFTVGTGFGSAHHNQGRLHRFFQGSGQLENGFAIPQIQGKGHQVGLLGRNLS